MRTDRFEFSSLERTAYVSSRGIERECLSKEFISVLCVWYPTTILLSTSQKFWVDGFSRCTFARENDKYLAQIGQDRGVTGVLQVVMFVVGYEERIVEQVIAVTGNR